LVNFCRRFASPSFDPNPLDSPALRRKALAAALDHASLGDVVAVLANRPEAMRALSKALSAANENGGYSS
jgi:hypothetical protein